jgi:uncharacterized protein
VRGFGPERRRRDAADGPGWLYAPEGHLRTPWRLLLFAGMLFVFGQIVPAFVVPIFAQISRWVGEPVPAYSWVMLGAVLLAIVVVLRMVDDQPWSAIGLGSEAWRPRPLLVGWLLGSGALAATAALLALPGYLRFEATAVPVIDGVQLSFLSVWLATAVRLAVLLAPAALWEELVFRGYLWKVAEDAGGTALALWSSSIAFGLVHLFNPNAGVRTTMLVVLAGICLGLLRLRLGLPAAWLAHLAWNWVMAAILHVPVSGVGFETPGYRGAVGGPAWLTGGEWGPEGGLVAAVVLGGALLVAARGEHLWRPSRELIDG